MSKTIDDKMMEQTIVNLGEVVSFGEVNQIEITFLYDEDTNLINIISDYVGNIRGDVFGSINGTVFGTVDGVEGDILNRRSNKNER